MNDERLSVNGDGNGGSSPALHFGRQVRKARLGKGWSIHQMAAEAGISSGHISRIENGLAKTTEKVAGKLDKAFPDRRGWFTEYHHDAREWAPPGYRLWGEYEDAAKRLHVWCPGTIDGLLQTEDYARDLLASAGDVPPEVIEARVKARMDRQRRVLHRENPPQVWMGVDELSLYCEIGSPEIMAAQLDAVLAVAALPHVVLQVVPAVGRPVSSELIVTDSAAFTDHVAETYTFTDPGMVTSMGRLMARLQGDSYRVRDSVTIIERIRDIWARGESPLSAMRRDQPA